jgi:hypothetical protein
MIRDTAFDRSNAWAPNVVSLLSGVAREPTRYTEWDR